ncbi:RimK family alpha-L-glutamate ligase [Thermomonas sp.]|uniref:RimK family alpha-L-glutamate ligase n=1 Tax=Thermomonas sp. TaxID=1971895 RepID=UPI0037834316
MTRVAILTPDPAEVAYPDLWPKVLARLQRALDGAGIEAVPTPWTAHMDDAAGLRDYASVLPLLVWGYHHDAARWQRACATWEREGVRLANPAKVLAWNTDKRYLRELAERGVAIPPTTFTDALSQNVVERAFADTGTDELIVKPAVSGGAWKTRRLRRGEAVGATDGMAMLLQPFLPTIETEGETSLLYFGGRLSHAVNKRPVAGEFRIQEEFGGQYALVPEPPAAAVALAEQVLQAVGEPLLYARIDMVPDADGRWLLMEAELIEPDFYLGVDPRHGAGFAQALDNFIRASDVR